jgi:5'-nucleotidase
MEKGVPGMPKTVAKAPLIVVSNDDGIRSPGIRALAGAMQAIGQVVVVAPDRERSAAGHSLTLSHPLRTEEIAPGWHSVDGTPTDCVNLAINGILRRRKVALVVSGINKGANMGDDITYSGTVAAALEGTLLGIPSVAFSLATWDRFDFGPAAAFAETVARNVLDHGLPKDTLLNVNVPPISLNEFAGVRVTRLGKRIYGDAIVRKRDPRGRHYYWIGGDVLAHEGVPGSDLEAVEEGFVSVTPLHLDMTHYDALKTLRRWKW